MPADPIARFQRWFAQARRTGMALPEAMTVATADARGRPSARMVLLKHANADGFVFYTNGRSRKGRELAANPRAALVFHWSPLNKQVRVEGPVREVSAAEADAYWATRPRASQLAALASAQSARLPTRSELMARWRVLARRYRNAAVPRPQHWTGYRVVPRSIEFWTHRDHRLHDRELFTRSGSGWKETRLQP
jgi:pyridoxamine 5'-phosphate oxidase